MSTDASVSGSASDPSRRRFLKGVGASLLSAATPAAFANRQPSERNPHFRPRARQVLQIFCPGGASHLDLWEWKPSLERYHGKPLPGEEDMVSFQGKNGTLMRSPWPFVQRGETGKRVSSLLPHMAEHVDRIAFVHSMTSKTNTHGPGCLFMDTASDVEGFPSAGAWVSYALGSLNPDLPTFVAIPDIRGEPPNGKANWGSGFLPARHQAMVMSTEIPMRNLVTPAPIDRAEESATSKLRSFLDRHHAQTHPGEDMWAARDAAYELAARMQVSAPEALDIDQEPEAIKRVYGTDSHDRLRRSYARQCLLARRLLERGVRYVTLFCGSRASGVDGLLNWDAHKTLKPDYERHAPIFDQPTAALLTDLRRRGLLDQTLVLWTTEFGRMPTHQQGTTGRDHNPDGFTCWMMGAGIREGVSFGATDEWGRRAEVDPVTVWDFYATALHALGLDHEALTYYFNGLDRRLTDVHGRIIPELLV